MGNSRLRRIRRFPHSGEHSARDSDRHRRGDRRCRQNQGLTGDGAPSHVMCPILIKCCDDPLKPHVTGTELARAYPTRRSRAPNTLRAVCVSWSSSDPPRRTYAGYHHPRPAAAGTIPDPEPRAHPGERRPSTSTTSSIVWNRSRIRGAIILRMTASSFCPSRICSYNWSNYLL